jgi:hypothetical protein
MAPGRLSSDAFSARKLCSTVWLSLRSAQDKGIYRECKGHSGYDSVVKMRRDQRFGPRFIG